MTKALHVLQTGPQSTVQDLGRPGLAALGVGTSGAADRAALRLANRLVGNPEGAAGLEVTFGGFAARAQGTLLLAVTGAPTPITLTVHGRERGEATHTVLAVPDGAELRLGPPAVGVRTYLAVHGGIAVEPVLHARATDLLAGLGPNPLAADARLPIGPGGKAWPGVDSAAVAPPAEGDVELRVVPGPRDDWFTPEALTTLLCAPYEVTSDSNRVGMRLSGPPLTRARDDELPSEGMVRGSLQVPPSGQPVLFLADHPVTGGYPVIACVLDRDVDLAAQARPSQRLRFRAVTTSTPRPRQSST